jgi:threonine/homoserine/homoserine lactone efflux protein
MDLSALLLFAAALFVNAGSPGPGITALVARVIGDGFRSVLPFLLAFWLGELLWLVAAVLGLSALAEASGAAFLLLRWAGVGLPPLARLEAVDAAPAAPEDLPSGESGWGIFLAGLALTLSNPRSWSSTSRSSRR